MKSDCLYMDTIGREGLSQMFDEAIDNFNYYKVIDKLTNDGEIHETDIPYEFSSPKRIRRELTRFLLNYEKSIWDGSPIKNFKSKHFGIEWEAYDVAETMKDTIVPYFTVSFHYDNKEVAYSYLLDSVDCYMDLYSKLSDSKLKLNNNNQ